MCRPRAKTPSVVLDIYCTVYCVYIYTHTPYIYIHSIYICCTDLFPANQIFTLLCRTFCLILQVILHLHFFFTECDCESGHCDMHTGECLPEAATVNLCNISKLTAVAESPVQQRTPVTTTNDKLFEMQL